MGGKIWVSKTSAEGQILDKQEACKKIQPITDKELFFSKYYPYILNSVVCGRLMVVKNNYSCENLL